ncbi:MAG: AAC(3) family N-acetyltransferase [Succinivibrio sp.]|nr:AAC(3) family N-acetyltransferase [Succinivibrio sp.]
MSLIRDLIEECPIGNGDTVEVASDLLKLSLLCLKHYEQLDADEVLNVLQQRVGTEGTLLIRAFSWDFCHGQPFDLRTSPSRVGALGNAALKRDDFKRTAHPLYSWLVWGRYQDELLALQNHSSFGADSPFGFLTAHGGKFLMLGADMYNSLTYVHYVEEQVGVPYRYLKNFRALYTDEQGNTSEREYSMNVRDLDLDVRMFNRESAADYPQTFEQEFTSKGLLKAREYEGVYVGVLDLAGAYPLIAADIRDNHSRKICRYRGQHG